MSTVIIHRTVRPWLYPAVSYLFSPKFYKGFVTSSLLHKYSRNIIKRRKDTFNAESVSSNIANDIDDEDFVYKTKNKKRLAMLDMLLYAKIMGEDIDEEGIREEVDTFVFEVGFSLLYFTDHSTSYIGDHHTFTFSVKKII